MNHDVIDASETGKKAEKTVAEATLEEMKEKSLFTSVWTATYKTVLWFTLPFVALYGLGLEPEHAARVAAGCAGFFAVAQSIVVLLASFAIACVAYFVKVADDRPKPSTRPWQDRPRPDPR